MIPSVDLKPPDGFVPTGLDVREACPEWAHARAAHGVRVWSNIDRVELVLFPVDAWSFEGTVALAARYGAKPSDDGTLFPRIANWLRGYVDTVRSGLFSVIGIPSYTWGIAPTEGTATPSPYSDPASRAGAPPYAPADTCLVDGECDGSCERWAELTDEQRYRAAELVARGLYAFEALAWAIAEELPCTVEDVRRLLRLGDTLDTIRVLALNAYAAKIPVLGLRSTLER
jgi:hypothetical protein